MKPQIEQFLFAGVGDHLAGAITGAATAVAVRVVVRPDLDMVLAMLAGMGLGMVVHAAFGVILSPLLGFFHLMVPGGVIGMYGGMFFAMRDTMQHAPGSLAAATLIGAIFGIAVVAAVQIYDRAIRAADARTLSL